MAVIGELTVCKAPAKLKLPWYSKTFFKVGRSAYSLSNLWFPPITCFLIILLVCLFYSHCDACSRLIASLCASSACFHCFFSCLLSQISLSISTWHLDLS